MSSSALLPSIQPAIRIEQTSMYYGAVRVVKDVSLDIRAHAVTAIIGPSGCGKSTLLRSINRMNDRVAGFRMAGTIRVGDEDVYDRTTDVVGLRRLVGMVFQRPNPFPQSIFANVAFGLTLDERPQPRELAQLVEESLRKATLWDEVKDKLQQPALTLSGGQQQRLCIARAIATRPDVLLMDEPCAALDPIAMLKIEELMVMLKQHYTILIVTHNMQQAARVSDITVMMTLDANDRAGYIVESGETAKLFTNPQAAETEAYVSGRFG
jgi:phosphate transport system ATP-binding protein